MARRVDSPKTARGSSTQTAASALQASDDVVFCGWTLKRGVFFWAPYYFAVTRHSELLWYEGGEAELKLAGKADLLLIKSITRDKPDSETNFSFRVVTPSTTVRLDPGTVANYDKWQEGLMNAVAQHSTFS